MTNSKECVKLEKLSTRTAHRTLKIKQREKDKIGTRNEFEKTFWCKLKQYFRKREVDSKNDKTLANVMRAFKSSEI